MARINPPFTVVRAKTFLFPLWWHTHAAVSHYYLLCFTGFQDEQSYHLPSGKVTTCELSRKLAASGVDIQSPLVTCYLEKCSEFGENRSDKEHRGDCCHLTWRGTDQSCTKTTLAMRWMNVPNWTCVRAVNGAVPFRKDYFSWAH